MIQSSQNDPHWKNLLLGFSKKNIGQFGCTITTIGNQFGITPDVVNARMKAVQGFAADPSTPDEKNLVIWKKLEEALPGVRFLNKYYSYDNTIILQNLPAIVEVDGAPIGGQRHWVLYIGNHQLIDPWDGQIKPTATYNAISFVLLSGQYTPQTASTGSYYKGLDLSNQESMKVAVDTWDAVVNQKQYVLKTDIPQGIDEQSIANYRAMQALGYNTVNDINNKIEQANEKIVELMRDTSVNSKKIHSLATTIQDDAKNSFTAIDEALKLVDENRELKEGLAQIAEVSDSPKADVKSIVANIFTLKDKAQAFMRLTQKDEQKVSPRKKADNIKPVQTQGVNWLLGLFQMLPTKEVKS